MGDDDPSEPRMVWSRPLLAGVLALYLGGYVAVRRAHLLVNYDGYRGYYSVRLFDTTGVVPPMAITSGCIAVVVFFPLHRLETLVRHGPINAYLSW